MFESTQAIDMGEMHPGSVRDVFHDYCPIDQLFPSARLLTLTCWVEGEVRLFRDRTNQY